MSSKPFTVKDIQVLPGFLAIRKRLDLYTKGDTHQERWQWLVHEVIKSAALEEMCNRPTKITVTLHQDEVVSIEDNGRGLPIYPSSSGIDVIENIKETEAEIVRPNLEFILTCVYAGLPDKKVYEKTGFLLGIGPVLTSATHSLTVTTWYNYKTYTMRFEEGKFVELLNYKGKTDKQGTNLTFKPSMDLWGTVPIDYRQLISRCDELQVLTTVEIDCYDLR